MTHKKHPECCCPGMGWTNQGTMGQMTVHPLRWMCSWWSPISDFAGNKLLVGGFRRVAPGRFLLGLLAAPSSAHWPLSAGGSQAQSASLPSVFSPQLCSHNVKTFNTVYVLMTLKCRPHSETLGCNIYLLVWHSLGDVIGIIILINPQTFSSRLPHFSKWHHHSWAD